MALEHLYVTTDGRLQIGNLAGAATNQLDSGERGKHAAPIEGSQGLAGSKLSNSATKKTSAASTGRSKESSGGSGGSGSNAIPTNSYCVVAPEILLGAEPSPDSSIYTAGSLCVQILTGGKPLIKVCGISLHCPSI